MSRSFWIGLASGIIYLYAAHLSRRDRGALLHTARALILSALGGAIILSAIYLPTIGGLGERARRILGEPAVSSRAAQFLPLLSAIAKSPLIGFGFGKTVTYASADPRILRANPDGLYTTYAFELGYLDIALKIGLLGLLLYALLIFKIARGLGRGELLAGLVALLVINIFSPYLNHPLGIGYLLLLTIFRKD
jgi:O-antigen ligase